MIALNVPAAILMLTLHTQAAEPNAKLFNRLEIWPSFGIYPIPKASRRLPLVATGNTVLRRLNIDTRDPPRPNAHWRRA